jgi:DNA-binding beta-propeller fold protein YncE
LQEVQRFPAPGPEPLGLAFDGTTLWVSSREGHRLYSVNPATWTVIEEFQTPGAPFGVAVGPKELRVVIGFGDDDDDRYIYRFDRNNGFASDRIACPDLSGVHIAFDSDTLYLSQAHNKKVLALDERGAITREIALDRRPLGLTIVDGTFYLITGNDNFEDHQLSKLDAREAQPRLTELATIPFRARELAFDGAHFWTADPRNNQIVAFEAKHERT